MTGVYLPKEIKKPIMELVDVFWKDWQEKVVDTFEAGGGSYIHVPYLDSRSADFDPLDLRVKVTIPSVLEDHGKGDKELYAAPMSLRQEILEIIADDPEGYRDRAIIMASALRSLADEMEALLAEGASELPT